MVNDIPVMHEVTASHALIEDFNQPEKVAECLRRLLHDKALYEELAMKGITRGKDFDFDKLAVERIEAIKELLQKE